MQQMRLKLLQKTHSVEATIKLVGNKIAGKITRTSKTSPKII